MVDTNVTVVGISHVPVVDSNLRLRQVTRVTIMVGSFGPFTQDFAPGQDSVDAINAWKLSKAQEIHNIAGVV
jgi:hypothetical protein